MVSSSITNRNEESGQAPVGVAVAVVVTEVVNVATGVEAVTVYWVIPMHEQALEYLTAPEHAVA